MRKGREAAEGGKKAGNEKTSKKNQK